MWATCFSSSVFLFICYFTGSDVEAEMEAKSESSGSGSAKNLPLPHRLFDLKSN